MTPITPPVDNVQIAQALHETLNLHQPFRPPDELVARATADYQDIISYVVRNLEDASSIQAVANACLKVKSLADADTRRLSRDVQAYFDILVQLSRMVEQNTDHVAAPTEDKEAQSKGAHNIENESSVDKTAKMQTLMGKAALGKARHNLTIKTNEIIDECEQLIHQNNARNDLSAVPTDGEELAPQLDGVLHGIADRESTDASAGLSDQANISEACQNNLKTQEHSASLLRRFTLFESTSNSNDCNDPEKHSAKVSSTSTERKCIPISSGTSREGRLGHRERFIIVTAISLGGIAAGSTAIYSAIMDTKENDHKILYAAMKKQEKQRLGTINNDYIFGRNNGGLLIPEGPSLA